MRIARKTFANSLCHSCWSIGVSVALSDSDCSCCAVGCFFCTESNRVRKDCSSGSLDTDRVFEVSPDTAVLVQTTVTEAPVPFDASLLSAVAESCLPLMLDGALSYNLRLVDPGSDVSLVTIPIYPVPAGMVLMPGPPSGQPASSPIRPSRQKHRSPAVSSSRDRSREGPFDAYCAPLDTGDHPLVSTGLPGCPYRMTSYAGTNVADLNPAYGIQVHHPRFLELIGLRCLPTY